MIEEEARRVLIVRAVEIEDTSASLLTREDRQQATCAGLAGATKDGEGRRADEAFLARRAAFAFGRLATRVPAVDRAFRAARWPEWLSWSLPLLAFALGIATNEISSGKRLNLIAFPLVGMVFWNLAIYLLLAVRRGRSLVRRGEPPAIGGFARATAWMSGLSRMGAGGDQPLGRALARFASDWMRRSRPLTTARVNRTLHLGAAGFAAGVVAGMYLRALGIEYRAGWESTFLHTGAVHRLLATMLAPASALTGIALPGPEHLAGLRWSEGPGEIAGRWIHLYAATALLFILVPRLLLGFGSALSALRLCRRVPVFGREDLHVRRLLRAAHGREAKARVVSYGFRPIETIRTGLDRMLSAALGDGARTTFDTPIQYGEEEGWLGRTSIGDEVDHLVVLFNLASTPEMENHGALVADVRKALEQGGGGTALTVVVDESAHRERLGSHAGSEGRIGTRRAAWERMLAEMNVRPFFVDLTLPEDPQVVGQLEAALLGTPTLMPTMAGRR